MTEHVPTDGEVWSRRVKLVLIGFSVIGGFFLIAEHRAHLLPFVPWLLLLACPLMHLFMHRGDGHGGHRNHDGSDPTGQHETRPTDHSHQHGEQS